MKLVLREELEPYLSRVNPWAAGICFGMLLLGFLLLERKRLRFSSVLFAVAAAAYLTFVLTITLLGRAPGVRSSFTTLLSTYQQMLGGVQGARLAVAFNILLFIPVGWITARYGVWKQQLTALALGSLAIECAQLVSTRGVFELSDIINNLLGGVIGLLMVYALRRLFRSIKEKRRKH